MNSCSKVRAEGNEARQKERDIPATLKWAGDLVD